MNVSAKEGDELRPRSVLSERRYSLPVLLAAIRAERVNRTLGNDHLSQEAVQSLFQARCMRHARTSK